MRLRWDDERWVKLYTRNTPDWLALPWEARAVYYELLRTVDKQGRMPRGRSSNEGLALLLGMPPDVVTLGLDALIAAGTVKLEGGDLFLVEFVESQAASSPKIRKQMSRLRLVTKEAS